MAEDPYAWITEMWKPTASQEARLSDCPVYRPSDCFTDSPSQPPGIVMISLPTSPDSVGEHVGGESGVDGRNKARASEAGTSVEREAKKIRSMEDEDVDDTDEIIVNLAEDDDIKTNGKRIDEFRYDRRRQLPDSLKEKGKGNGKEKEEERVVETSGLLDVFKAFVVNTDDDSEEDENEDWFDMIQRKGLITFPKPRWWP